MKILKYLDGGPILNLVFLIIAVFGILIALYYGRKIKKLVFNIKSTNLIRSYENIIPQITVLYKDLPIPNLTVARVAIWNFGNDVINQIDVPKLDQIKLTLNNPFQFLETAVNFTSKVSNNFAIQVSEAKNELVITFDFIEQNDGLTLTLFHTGNSTDLIVKGAVKGADKIEDYSFLTWYNVGALVGKLMLVKIGGKKGTFLGTVIRVVFAPILFLLILPGDIVLSLGNGRLKYKLIKKEYFLV